MLLASIPKRDAVKLRNFLLAANPETRIHLFESLINVRSVIILVVIVSGRIIASANLPSNGVIVLHPGRTQSTRSYLILGSQRRDHWPAAVASLQCDARVFTGQPETAAESMRTEACSAAGIEDPIHAEVRRICLVSYIKPRNIPHTVTALPTIAVPEKIDSTSVIVEGCEMKTYFKSPGLFWWIIIPFGLTVAFMAWLCPELLESLPLVGPFAAWVGREMPDFVKFVVLIATLLHVAEAIYALLLCLTHELTKWCTVLWTVQTFILGFPSLHLLQNGISKLTK